MFLFEKKMFVVGIDIGGTFIKIGVFQADNLQLVQKFVLNTTQFKTFESLALEVQEILIHYQDLQGIGIGAPNGNYFDGTIKFAPNLSWQGQIPVVQIFRKFFTNAHIVLNNDANAAALGEMLFGKAKGLKHFMQITLGTGVGGGIIVNGKLLYGFDGNAGEIGHTIYEPDGRQCNCGKKGCLEMYASARGLVMTTKELLMIRKTPSMLKNLPEIDAFVISTAAANGDPIALEAFEITAKILAKQLSDCAAILAPSKIFVSGGLSKAGTVLFEPLNKYFQHFLLSIHKNIISIEQSGLPDDNAGILGAVALVVKK